MIAKMPIRLDSNWFTIGLLMINFIGVTLTQLSA
jgi:hypothetical protein